MKRGKELSVLGISLAVIVGACFGSTIHSDPLIIDHTCADLSVIPDEWIDSVQANIRLHYVHASHGAQLTCGLERLEDADAKFSVAIETEYLPTEPGALCVFDKEGDPNGYWLLPGINSTRDVLHNNPTINVSAFCWCIQLEYYDGAYVQSYLDSMEALINEFPHVSFVHMTSQAQGYNELGYNRYVNDIIIRDHCIAEERVLYDFEDLDSWCYVDGEWDENRWTAGGYDYPFWHEPCWDWNGWCGHAPPEACDQKAEALWWMLAKIAGWMGEGANRPPVLNAIGEQTVDEGDTLILQVTASDPDSDPITLSASPVPPNATFTDQRDGTGDFFFTPDSTQAGSYEIVFTAFDGEYSDSERVVINVTTVGLEESIIEIPESAGRMLRISPNPFTDAATLAYSLGSESTVRVEVYSSHGRLMRTLCEGRRSPGLHEIRWTSGDLPSGVYFLRLETDQYSSTEKAVLTR
jgi:hypothetical protein